MNVLFVEPPEERRVGGIETALAGWARALTREGFVVHRSVTATTSEIKTADIVHFHGLWEPAHIALRQRCSRAQRPFIVSPHGMLEDWAFLHRGWKKRPYFHLLEKPSLLRAAAIVATSHEEAATLHRRVPEAKVLTLPLGADPVPIPPFAEAKSSAGWVSDDFRLLFLSRCHEKKGLHTLLEVLPEAAEQAERRVHLIIVGDGDDAYVAPLQKATQRWAGLAHATWAGPCWGPEKWNYLVSADLLCLPTFSENFGLVVLESLFAGTPVLTTYATPWPSLRQALPVHLTKPDRESLKRALVDRLREPRPAAAQRSAVRMAAIAAFGWPALAPRYAAMYEGLCRQRSMRPT